MTSTLLDQWTFAGTYHIRRVFIVGQTECALDDHVACLNHLKRRETIAGNIIYHFVINYWVIIEGKRQNDIAQEGRKKHQCSPCRKNRIIGHKVQPHSFKTYCSAMLTRFHDSLGVYKVKVGARQSSPSRKTTPGLLRPSKTNQLQKFNRNQC